MMTVMRITLIVLVCVCVGALAADPAGKPLPARPADLYQETAVWNVHLKFSPEQWQAMEPAQARPRFGPPAPGGPGGRPGSANLGPGAFIAPVILQQADQNKDQKLSADELTALADKWFTAWDKEKVGKINSDQLRLGLNGTFAPPPNAQPRPFLQGQENKRNGLASAMGIEFQYVHADMEFEGKTFTDVGVRYKGNGTFVESRGTMKRSLKVDLNQYVKTNKFAGVSQLNFHNNYTDGSWMNEVLSHRLYRDAGIPAPRSAYARLFVTVPGKYDRKYFGLYSLVEDVGKAFIDERFDAKDGALLKPVTPNLFNDLGDDWKSYNQTYDPKTKLTPKQAQRIIEFCKLVSHADDDAFAAKLGDYIDLDEFARYLAVTVFISDLDGILGPGQNMYLYLHPRTNKYLFISWDQDHSFGQFAFAGNQKQRDHLSIQKPWRGRNPFLERVFKVEAFKKLYLAKLEEYSKTLFNPQRFHEQVDTIAVAIRPAVQEESETKLVRFDKLVAGQLVGSGGIGVFFTDPTKPIKPFVKVRQQSIVDQLAGKNPGETIGPVGLDAPPPDRNRPPGPPQFGPGNFLGPAFMTALDADKDSTLTREEFTRGLGNRFQTWDMNKAGLLTADQLSAGLSKDLAPPPPGPRR